MFAAHNALFTTSSVLSTDQYRNYVVALLHGNGTNGSSTIIDSSPKAANWTSGGATISTAQKKFGTGSIYFNGSSGCRIIGGGAISNYAFGYDDFTIEFWYYTTNVNTFNAQNVYVGSGASFGSTDPLIYILSGTLYYYVNGANRLSTTITANTWHHITVSRASNSTYLFLNGAIVGGWSDGTNYGAAAPPTFGYINSSTLQDAYIDDVRITKGIGRYTATFSVSTSELPDG